MPFTGAISVIKQSLRVIKSNPHIMIYPYLALFFISITYPILSASIFARWYNRIFVDAGSVAPHRMNIILGLVGFSAFYTAFVTAIFSCAVSAEVSAKMEDRSAPPLYGLVRVMRHFFRVAKFAVLSIFFLPVGIYAQRGKLPRGVIGVIGSSLTLHMAQVAPSILNTNHRFGTTIRDSIDTLGRAWREGLVLKIGMYLTIFLIVVLPKLIQHQWFKSQTASNVSWLISLELAASSYVTLKVINSVFTTVLYHQAKLQENN
jgi:hypothetical protein